MESKTKVDMLGGSEGEKWGTCLALSEECVTLELSFVSSSSTVGVEII